MQEIGNFGCLKYCWLSQLLQRIYMTPSLEPGCLKRGPILLNTSYFEEIAIDQEANKFE